MRAPRVEEDEHAVGAEGNVFHQLAVAWLDVIDAAGRRRRVVSNTIELRAVRFAVAFARQIGDAGHESPLRVAVRHQVVAGAAQHDAAVRGVQRQVHVRRQHGAERPDVLADDALELSVQCLVDHRADDLVGDKRPYLPRVERCDAGRHGPVLVAIARKEDRRWHRVYDPLIHSVWQPLLDDQMRKRIEFQRCGLEGSRDVRGDRFLIKRTGEPCQVEAFLPVHALDGQDLLALDAQRIDGGAQLSRLVRDGVHARQRAEECSGAKQIGGRRQAPEELSRHEFLK